MFFYILVPKEKRIFKIVFCSRECLLFSFFLSKAALEDGFRRGLSKDKKIMHNLQINDEICDIDIEFDDPQPVDTAYKTKGELPFETEEQKAASLAPFRKQIAKDFEIVTEIFRLTNVPESARNLISTLIRLSGGDVQIQIRDAQIAMAFFENKPMHDALKKRVQRWRKALNDWQDETGITLVEINSGYRKIRFGKDMKPFNENVPSTYRLLVLEMAAKILSQQDIAIEIAARKIIDELTCRAPQPQEKRTRPKNPEQWRNSALTYLRKAMTAADEGGYLNDFYRELEEDLAKLKAEFPVGGMKSSYLETDLENSSETGEGGTNLGTINILSTSSLSISNNSIEDKPSNELETSPTNNNPSMLDQALALANQGFRIFPVHSVADGICTCNQGEKCSAKGKHPHITSWHFLATTNQEEIRKWWRQFRNANIGIATGSFMSLKKSFLVLDIDPKNGGAESLAALEKEFGKLPETLTARTGSGGKHIFLKIAPFSMGIVRNIQNSEKIGKGIDIRGDGGFVVAAGSIHKSGNRYEWIDENAEMAEMPEWLIKKIKAENAPPAKEKIETKKTTQTAAVPVQPLSNYLVPVGGRDNFLFRQARGLINSYTDEEVIKRLKHLRDTRCEKPKEISDQQIEAKVKSANGYKTKTFRERLEETKLSRILQK